MFSWEFQTRQNIFKIEVKIDKNKAWKVNKSKKVLSNESSISWL